MDIQILLCICHSYSLLHMHTCVLSLFLWPDPGTNNHQLAMPWHHTCSLTFQTLKPRVRCYWLMFYALLLHLFFWIPFNLLHSSTLINTSLSHLVEETWWRIIDSSFTCSKVSSPIARSTAPISAKVPCSSDACHALEQ